MNPKLLLIATLSAATLSPCAYAQPVLKPAAPEAAQPQRSAVKEVLSGIMAYWLDPAHNSVFPAYKGVKPTWAIGRTADEVKAMLTLPSGVQSVIAIEPQNALLVFGTPKGIEELTAKIALLDKPLRQAQFEAKIVQISAADVKALKIDFVKGESVIDIGITGPVVQDLIAAMVAQNRAKIIVAPRVTACFGQTASILNTTTVSVVIGLKNENNVVIRELAGAERQGKEAMKIGVSSSIGFSVTPTWNPDASISLQMGPIRPWGLSALNGDFANKKPDDSIVLKDPDGIPTQLITLKEGQTAVLQGLNWHITPEGRLAFLDDPKVPAQNVIVLITTRVLHHDGE